MIKRGTVPTKCLWQHPGDCLVIENDSNRGKIGCHRGKPGFTVAKSVKPVCPGGILVHPVGVGGGGGYKCVVHNFNKISLKFQLRFDNVLLDQNI